MRIAVLGAGLQGVSVALVLARSGHAVTIFDREPDCLLGASLRNEGKIHLGFTYANDPSLRTSRLMLESALVFAPLLDEWAGRRLPWEELRSRPFTYAVMDDSMVPFAALREHYEQVADAFRALRPAEGVNYLGTDPATLVWGIPIPGYLAPGKVVGAVETAERALDLVAFRREMKGALARNDAVTTRFGHTVTAVSRDASGFTVAGHAAGEGWAFGSDVVVNCLWDGRLAIDQQLGLLPDMPWVYRLKYRVLAELPAELAAMSALTFVLGPYGDIVPLRGSSYLSWYPASLQGWSTDVVAPQAWRSSVPGTAGIARRVLDGLDQVVPGVASSNVELVDAGVVVAWGSTDIDHPDSRFHQRFAVGVTEDDGYFSVDTGKLTCAPRFADELARRVQ